MQAARKVAHKSSNNLQSETIYNPIFESDFYDSDLDSSTEVKIKKEEPKKESNIEIKKEVNIVEKSEPKVENPEDGLNSCDYEDDSFDGSSSFDDEDSGSNFSDSGECGEEEDSDIEPPSHKKVKIDEDMTEESKNKETKNNQRKRYNCKNCCQTFKNSMSLRKHKEIHSNDAKGFKSEFCQGVFKTEKSLECHNNRYHSTKYKKVTKLVTKSSVGTIIERKVTGFQCPECCCILKNLRSRRMEKHMEAHPAENEKHLKCEYCGGRFYDRKRLNNHVGRWHTVKDSVYKCDDCNYSAKTRDAVYWWVVSVIIARINCKRTLRIYFFEITPIFFGFIRWSCDKTLISLRSLEILVELETTYSSAQKNSHRKNRRLYLPYM